MKIQAFLMAIAVAVPFLASPTTAYAGKLKYLSVPNWAFGPAGARCAGDDCESSYYTYHAYKKWQKKEKEKSS